MTRGWESASPPRFTQERNVCSDGPTKTASTSGSSATSLQAISAWGPPTATFSRGSRVSSLWMSSRARPHSGLATDRPRNRGVPGNKDPHLIVQGAFVAFVHQHRVSVPFEIRGQSPNAQKREHSLAGNISGMETPMPSRIGVSEPGIAPRGYDDGDAPTQDILRMNRVGSLLQWTGNGKSVKRIGVADPYREAANSEFYLPLSR